MIRQERKIAMAKKKELFRRQRKTYLPQVSFSGRGILRVDELWRTKLLLYAKKPSVRHENRNIAFYSNSSAMIEDRRSSFRHRYGCFQNVLCRL